MKCFAKYSILISLFFGSCAPQVNKLSIDHQDTIKCGNGYVVVLDGNKNLKKILKPYNKKDTILMSFSNDDYSILYANSKIRKKYYYNNDNSALNKLKYSLILKENQFYENQIIYIDTLSDNFQVKEGSNYIDFKDLPDTLKSNEAVLRINYSDSTFKKFRLNIIDPTKGLSLDYKNVIKKKDFFYKVGVIDTLKSSVKGDYLYQGFIENYMLTENGNRAVMFCFFKKKVYIE